MRHLRGKGAIIAIVMSAKWLVGMALFGAWAPIAACGARTALELDELGLPPGTGGSAGAGAGGSSPACEEGEERICGSNVGACRTGIQTCRNGVFGPCVGEIGPREEECNGIDDDCNGEIDEPFGLGAPCDGPDSDLCLDDVMTCDGCSHGPDNIEICNGVDDNCNGIIDADCELGDCQPTLIVTGSTPSSPSCIDFPVTAGSEGVIQYPCAGGSVTAVLGEIEFSGHVQNGVVSLHGFAIVVGPDNCLWRTDHYIDGVISSGMLSYFYQELLLDPWPFCWSACYETGDVAVLWTAP